MVMLMATVMTMSMVMMMVMTMLLIYKTKTGGRAARHHLLPIICLNNKLPQLKPTITQVLGKNRPWKLSNYANPNFTMFTNENNFFPNCLLAKSLVPCSMSSAHLSLSKTVVW